MIPEFKIPYFATMYYSIIAAISKNNVLGKDNQLLWKLSDDMKMFRQLTTGNCVVMGRKTFESMGKALPNRTNIIITRSNDYSAADCLIAKSFEEAIEQAKSIGTKIYVIGGGEIYNIAIQNAIELIITHVNCNVEGDTFFPEIDAAIWSESERLSYLKNEKNEFDFEVIKYLRK